ncbi:MAG: VapB-type antitoxin [Nanoarchaeota archaeon]
MDDAIISVRVNKELKEKMKMQEEINWSAVLRRAIIESLQNKEKIDLEKRMRASEGIDKIRKSGIFNGGKEGTRIIREWRDKRR